jgi:Secretion system C-terminal sorting domain
MLKLIKSTQLLIFIVFISCTLNSRAQNYNYQWTVAGGSVGIDAGTGVTTDRNKNVYSVGSFTGTVDFDPGPGSNTLTASGTGSGYLVKYDANSNFQWVLPISGSVSASCWDICSDTSDNIYIIGEVNGTSGDFDPGAGVTSITSAGLTDVYIAKYTSSAQFVWIQQFGGTSNEFARKIKTGKNNELVVTCNFEGTVDFDPGPGVNNITSAGSTDVFIARIYTDGVLDWVKTIGNSGGNQGPGIGVDESGYIYSVGSFSGTIDTDPDITNTNFLTATGTASDGLIIKLDSNGIFQWSHNISSNSGALINDVEPDRDNNIYLTGWFSGFVDFDPSNGMDTYTNVSGIDAFFWKMTANGNHVWAKVTGNSLPEFYDGRSVKIASNGSPYVLGVFEGSADFDPGAGTSTESSLGDFDIFVWGLYPNGSFSFSKSIGGSGKEVSADLHIDVSDNIYFSGFFSSPVDFNPWSGTNLISPASTFADFHVNKWSSCLTSSSTVTQSVCDSVFTFNGQTYTSSGTYTQILTNSIGCDSLITLQLSLTNINTATNLSGAVLTSLQNGASYQWYTCNGTWLPVNNATQQSFTATQNGQYAVILNLNGCSDTSSCITISGVGIEQNAVNNFCTIYPNPSSNILYIDWKIIDTNTTVYIYNSLGQLVKEEDVQGKLQTKISLQQPAGYYIIKIVANNSQITVPLIIQ